MQEPWVLTCGGLPVQVALRLTAQRGQGGVGAALLEVAAAPITLFGGPQRLVSGVLSLRNACPTSATKYYHTRICNCK